MASYRGGHTSIEGVYPKETFNKIHKLFFEVRILGIPPRAYGGPKSHQQLVHQVHLKMIISYTQKYMIINFKIIIYMLYVWDRQPEIIKI